MNYYLFITDEYNWKILQNKEFWPFKHKTKKIISSIDINDIFFIYLKQKINPYIPPRIVAKGKIKSKYKSNSDNSVYSNKEYPYILYYKLLNIYDPYFNFKNIINYLNLFSNKKNWGLKLMGKSVIQIDEQDYNVILGLNQC